MSQSAIPAPPSMKGSAAPLLDVSGTEPIPFWRLILVEMRKSFDTRAGFWLLIAIAILVGLVEGFIFVVTLVQSSTVYFTDYAFIAGGLTSLLLPVLAIMLVTGEWSQRSAMVSFALEPRRSRVVLAKLAVSFLYVAATLVAMLVIALVLTGLCEVIQPDQTYWDFDTGLFLGFAIGQILTMTVGFAFAALLLNTPAAIVVFFLYWYLLPVILFAVGSIRESIGDALEWINFQAALGPLMDWDLSSAEDAAKLVVSATLWIILPLTAGLWRILRAEVK